MTERDDDDDGGCTGRLIELLECMRSCADVAAAAQAALPHVLDLFAAHAGALGWDGAVLAQAGAVQRLDQSAQGWHLLREPLRGAGGWLAIAREGTPPTVAERKLATLTALVLGNALSELAIVARERTLSMRSESDGIENERLRAALQARQALLERLSRIQRAIVHRASLGVVLDTVLVDVTELLAADLGYVLLIDRSEPERMVIAAARGLPEGPLSDAPQLPLTHGLGGRAVQAAALVSTPDYSNEPWVWAPMRALGLRAAMAAPLWEHGRVVGALLVARRSDPRPFTAGEQDTLLAFAEHASLALSDAQNLDAAMHRAYHDLLTGLPNRALFLERLEHAQRRAQRSGESVAVLFLDLDGFKRVNDSLGHAAGDQLLIEVAGRLEDCLRPTDTAARFGGDEFAILLDGLERGADATIVASRILLALQEPIELNGRRATVSASIGVALHRDQHNDLLRDADLAMYRAKSAGRNRYEVFDTALHAVAMENMRLEAELQHAVEHGELVLHFQPIVSLASGAVEGVEALVRWAHPERGLLGPDAFVAAAEQTSVICALGRWVLNEACREALRWRGPGGRGAVPVSVNLSVNQLRQPGLIYEVAEALERSGLEPSGLVLEVTETMLTDDVDQMAATLSDLKRLGVQLAVDDFGTGYSSLQYLRLFPIDILKIAKPFVDGIDRGDSRLARVILDLGKSLKLRVIAEGIERPSQALLLRRLGCTSGQGYHYARPLTAEGIRELLASGGAMPARGRLAAVGGK